VDDQVCSPFNLSQNPYEAATKFITKQRAPGRVLAGIVRKTDLFAIHTYFAQNYEFFLFYTPILQLRRTTSFIDCSKLNYMNFCHLDLSTIGLRTMTFPWNPKHSVANGFSPRLLIKYEEPRSKDFSVRYVTAFTEYNSSLLVSLPDFNLDEVQFC